MGALQKIRSKSTLLVAVIAVGLLAFVVPWGEISQFLNVSKDKAFVVNGDVVKTGEYAQRIAQEETMNDGQLDELQQAQLRENVYQTIVTEKLLQDQSEKLGLTVTRVELNDMAHGFNMSPVLYRVFTNRQTGQFDREGLNQYLTMVNEPISSDPKTRHQQEEMRKRWSYIENSMYYDRLQEKYSSLIAGAVLVNDIETKAYYEDSKNVATIAYVMADYNDIEDSEIEISTNELQDLYNIKKENFLSKYPMRQLTYFVKSILPSEKDYADTEEQIKEIKKELETTDNVGMIVNQYSTRQFMDAHLSLGNLSPEIRTFVQNASVGDIHGPTRGDKSFTMYKYVSKTMAADSVKILTIPVQSFDPTQAVAIADSLKAELKKGKSFAALATEMYPNMPELAKGEWVIEDMLTGIGIGEKIFSANKGDVVTADMQGGMTYLIKIDDKTKATTKVKVAEIHIPVIVSDKTNNTIDNEINKFISENKDPKTFKDAALNQGYDVKEDVVVYPNNPGVDNITGTRDVIRWAFNENKGEVKKFETREVKIVAVVTGEEKEGYLSINNKLVDEALRNELMKTKKAERIMLDLKTKNLTSLEDYAETLESKVDTAKFISFQTNNISGVGYEPIFNVMSKISPKELNPKLAEGMRGVYIYTLSDKSEEVGDYNPSVIKNILHNQNGQILVNSAPYMLISKMNVEDNRIQFY